MKDTPFTADRLLTLYDQVAKAEDAIPRLRRFVLDLAVRGKLVEQDLTDEPAAELLKRIANEKARLVKAGEIRQREDLAEVAEDQHPYVLPKSWTWVRLAHVADFLAGRTPARNEPSFWNTGDYPWVSIADMQDGATLDETKESVSELAAQKVFGAPPSRAGTMIMSFKLTIGKIARLGIDAYLFHPG
jgi:type I restriction enzyme S subunit